MEHVDGLDDCELERLLALLPKGGETSEGRVRIKVSRIDDATLQPHDWT